MIVGRPFAAAGDGFVEMGAGVAGFAGGVQLALADVVGRGAGIVEGVAAARTGGGGVGIAPPCAAATRSAIANSCGRSPRVSRP